ncbi:MAG TPA: hypothetical protein VFE47_30125 [Tepidisphaeraceae bacterium]|jgi:hypothetical protein|nr:hypothetical protein [Tepidisphaeraceae bacterium]
MIVNAIEGVVENGRIRLREDVNLPENARVFVVVVEKSERPVAHIRSPRLANSEDAIHFRKQVVELPPDAKI